MIIKNCRTNCPLREHTKDWCTEAVNVLGTTKYEKCSKDNSVSVLVSLPIQGGSYTVDIDQMHQQVLDCKIAVPRNQFIQISEQHHSSGHQVGEMLQHAMIMMLYLIAANDYAPKIAPLTEQNTLEGWILYTKEMALLSVEVYREEICLVRIVNGNSSDIPVYLEGNYKAILRFLVFLYLRLNVGILEFPDYKHYLFDDSDTDGVNVGVLTPPLDIVKEIFEQNGYIMRNLPINDSRSFPPKEQLCFMASRLCYAFWNIYTVVGALNHYEYHSSTFSERLRPVRYVDFWGKAEKTTCVMPWGFNMYMPVGPHFCYLVESGRRANP